MKSAIVMLSGGMDSAVALAFALNVGYDETVAINFDYGQLAGEEIERTDALCTHYNIPLYRMNVQDIFSYSNCALTNDDDKHRYDNYVFQDSGKDSEVWEPSLVPFRNGFFLSATAVLAMSLYLPKDSVDIYTGFIKCVYPDTTPAFVTKAQEFLSEGSDKIIKNVVTPLIHMVKTEVIKKGMELGVPFELTYSCDRGGAKQCGECESCRERKEAFEELGIPDPAGYM